MIKSGNIREVAVKKASMKSESEFNVHQEKKKNREMLIAKKSILCHKSQNNPSPKK